MPELPEVETVRQTLAPVLGRRVVTVWRSRLLLRGERGRPPSLAALRGVTLTGLQRRGKFLWLQTSGPSVTVHLGMSGRLVVRPAPSPLWPHTHVRLSLDDGQELRLTDPRRFGMFRLDPGDEPAEWHRLGPDPLSDRFTVAALADALGGTARAMKDALMDQSVVAGLGNIYVAEALWEAGIHPQARADRVPAAQVARLHGAVRRVLKRALSHGGTSLKDFVDGTGREGSNQDYLRVYGRAGEACRRCGAELALTRQGARATYHCPGCQRLSGSAPAGGSRSRASPRGATSP